MTELTRGEINVLSAFAHAFDMIRWISVTEGLPDNEREVLVCTRSKSGSRNIDKGYYISDLCRWAHRGTAEVTHWRELPELPEVMSND